MRRFIGDEEYGTKPTCLSLELALIDTLTTCAEWWMGRVHQKCVSQFVGKVATLPIRRMAMVMDY